jgi:ADP-ribosylglycohydrolase
MHVRGTANQTLANPLAFDTFKAGELLAANLGDDSDGVAAVYGQLAGAFHGAEAIPADWLEKHDYARPYPATG